MKKTMDKNEFLVGFKEFPVRFNPTFKFDKKGDGYKASRVPSHTDRILSRSAHVHGNRLVQTDYTSGEVKSNSDHRPVRANFELQYAKKKQGNSESLTVCVDNIQVGSSEFNNVEPLVVQGKIIGTNEWRDMEALWSTGGRASFKDSLSFNVLSSEACEKVVILEVRLLAKFGEEGDSFGVCGIPLSADNAEIREGDEYTFSARLCRASKAVGLLSGRLTIGSSP